MIGVAPDHGVPQKQVVLVNLIEHATGIEHAGLRRRSGEESDDPACEKGVLYEAGSDHLGMDLNQFLHFGASLEKGDDVLIMWCDPSLVG